MIYTAQFPTTANHCLTLEEFSVVELQKFMKWSYTLKNSLKKQEDILKGKVLGMIFEKNSTRTRVSFEVGMLQLGGHAICMNGKDLQLGRGETIADTARTLSEYVDGIMIRTHEHSKVEDLALYGSIPIINGLTDIHHPCQALADYLTIYEHTQNFDQWKLTYLGDGNNVCHSLLLAGAMLGAHVVYSTPKDCKPSPEILKKVEAYAALTGAHVVYEEDPFKACEGANFIYTDVWASMGFDDSAQKLQQLKQYAVTEDKVKYAHHNYRFLHCLPAHRDEEVDTSIIDGQHSSVFQQAGNRLHAQKALLIALLGK